MQQTNGAIGATLDLVQDQRIEQDLRRHWTRLTAPDTAEAKRIEKRVHTLESEIGRGQQAIASATRLFALGEIDKTAYDVVVRAEQKANDARRTQLEELRAKPSVPTLPSLESVLASVGSWSRVLNDETQDARLIRDIVSLLVDHVVPCVCAGQGHDVIGVLRSILAVATSRQRCSNGTTTACAPRQKRAAAVGLTIRMRPASPQLAQCFAVSKHRLRVTSYNECSLGRMLTGHHQLW